MTEYINPMTQTRLAAVLRYREHGDFAAFCRAADLAVGAEVSSEPYYCANLLLAYQLSGMCEVSNATGSTQWWISHSSDIRIQSQTPKEVGVMPAWFAGNSEGIEPLIADSTGAALVLGRRSPQLQGGPTRSVFSSPLVEIVPPFRDIERQLCVEVPFSDDVPGYVEVFDEKSGQWSPEPLDTLQGSQLIRTRKEYAGVAYYVQHSALSLRFKITQPEWAFVVAYHLLPWRLSDLVELGIQHVRIRRAIRFPILMSRPLFAAAARAQVGPIVTFVDVAPDCIQGFRSYFEQVGDRT